MRLHDLIDSALSAAGGLESIRAITSYRARFREEPTGLVAQIARAAGGRIRLDQTIGSRAHSIFVNGDIGMEVIGDVVRTLIKDEVAEIRRAARLVPRNLLAHANEYDLSLEEEADGYRLFFPAEGCLYFFDGHSVLCRRLFDGRSGATTEYSEYREVAGVMTAFHEIVTSDRHDPIERSYESVEYNVALEESLFEVPRLQ